MKLIVKSLVVCCLAVASVLSLPIPEDASTTEVAEAATTNEPAGETTEPAKTDEDTKSPEGAEPSAPASEKPAEGPAKDDRQGTYNKVNELLEKDTDVKKIDNPFLRGFLDNNLQSHLRVPVVDAIAMVGDFTKIAGCFTSMGPDVKKIIDDKLKSFTTCKSGKDSTDSNCSEDSAIGGQFDQITSKVKECVSSKAKGK